MLQWLVTAVDKAVSQVQTIKHTRVLKRLTITPDVTHPNDDIQQQYMMLHTKVFDAICR